MNREYALRFDTPQGPVYHSHTENEFVVNVWRDHPHPRITIVYREVGEWKECE